MGKVGSYNLASRLTGAEEITLKQGTTTYRSAINDLSITPTGSSTQRTLAEWMASIGSLPDFTDGTGDEQHIFLAATGQVLDLRQGTNASPHTSGSSGPLFKATRTLEYTSTAGSGDNAENWAAITGMGAGVGSTIGQPVGVFGGASNESSASGSGGMRPDAVGVYGMGRILDGGTGIGIGAFFAGQADGTGGQLTAVEMQARNRTGSAGTYNSSGFSSISGLWMSVAGDNDAGVGIQLGNPNGLQFAVGLAFNGQVAGGKTGPVSGSSIRDDSHSQTSLDVRGAHVIALDASNATLSGGVVYAPNNVPLIRARNFANDAYDNVLFYDVNDVLRVGSSDTTGIMLATGAAQTVGFYGTAGVAQQTGVAVSSAGIHAALVSLGLITA